MPCSRVSGCVIWAGWAAPGRHGPAEPGPAVHPLHAAAPAPMALPSPPARRRAPARPAHAPEQTSSWHPPSRAAPDPFLAALVHLFLPEGDVHLQDVDRVLARGERIAAVR